MPCNQNRLTERKEAVEGLRSQPHEAGRGLVNFPGLKLCSVRVHALERYVQHSLRGHTGASEQSHACCPPKHS